MRISILTLFPEMYEGFLTTSIIKKAILQNLVQVDLIDIRSFSTNKHKRVDDAPFGGGQGLVMAMQPIMDALKSVDHTHAHVMLTSASGPTLVQSKVRELSTKEHIVLICGHYEGIDARIHEHIDESYSIGDYILTGGELPSMVLSDAIIRLLDGVIRESSHQDESYENGLLEYPHYTRPQHYEDQSVPDVLMSGNHEDIRKYRLKESLRNTWMHRPDLFKDRVFTQEEKNLLIEIIKELS